MIAERQRVPEDSGEMGETIYDAPTGPEPELPKPTPTPKPVTEVQAPTAPAAQSSSTPRPTAARTNNAPKAAPVSAPASGDNATLRMVLGVAAALFVLSIVVVAVLYMMGKI